MRNQNALSWCTEIQSLPMAPPRHFPLPCKCNLCVLTALPTTKANFGVSVVVAQCSTTLISVIVRVCNPVIWMLPYLQQRQRRHGKAGRAALPAACGGSGSGSRDRMRSRRRARVYSCGCACAFVQLPAARTRQGHVARPIPSARFEPAPKRSRPGALRAALASTRGRG